MRRAGQEWVDRWDAMGRMSEVGQGEVRMLFDEGMVLGSAFMVRSEDCSLILCLSLVHDDVIGRCGGAWIGVGLD